MCTFLRDPHCNAPLESCCPHPSPIQAEAVGWLVCTCPTADILLSYAPPTSQTRPPEPQSSWLQYVRSFHFLTDLTEFKDGLGTRSSKYQHSQASVSLTQAWIILSQILSLKVRQPHPPCPQSDSQEANPTNSVTQSNEHGLNSFSGGSSGLPKSLLPEMTVPPFWQKMLRNSRTWAVNIKKFCFNPGNSLGRLVEIQVGTACQSCLPYHLSASLLTSLTYLRIWLWTLPFIYQHLDGK